LDGGLIRAVRKKRLVVINERGRRQVIDGGYTGSISEINAELLNLLLNSGYVPVISPVAMSEEFEPLNVDGDRVAAKIAAALKADILVLLTDVEGVALEGKTVSRLGLNETREILPKIGPGMITKLQAATEALENGVKEVVISSGQRQRPISSAINHQVGTVISNG
jgi:acetylglutamate/LysW-gamma-L-alpha-aminoadipate kinase